MIKTKKYQDSEDLYYLAGTYEPTTGMIFNTDGVPVICWGSTNETWNQTNEIQGLDRCVGFTQSPTNQTSTENVLTKTQASVEIRDHFIRCPSLQTRWWRYCQIALDSKFNASVWSVNGVLCFMIVVDNWCSWGISSWRVKCGKESESASKMSWRSTTSAPLSPVFLSHHWCSWNGGDTTSAGLVLRVRRPAWNQLLWPWDQQRKE